MRKSDHVNLLFWGVLLPILGSVVSIEFFMDWRFEHLSAHMALEILGSLAAFTILFIIYISPRSLELEEGELSFLTMALMAMGLLDAFHAMALPGNNFVWLHSAATLAGGGFLALIWFSERPVPHVSQLFNVLIISVATLGIYSFVHPEVMPTMLDGGTFTIIARLMNIGGGIGFFLGAWYFYSRYRWFHRRGYYLLAAHCLLFGMAGILFEVSALWDLA
ncbi:MAG: MASE3 domain-containing protein, partial [Rickettsiales bacterium]